MATVSDKVRVLVIDDLADARNLLTSLYEHAGAEVTSAATGREGIAAIQAAIKSQKPFHLVSTDIKMPELDGLDASKEIRNAGFTGSIVAFTATVNMHDRQKGQKNGINRYFAKTSIKREIIEAIIDQVRRGELI